MFLCVMPVGSRVPVCDARGTGMSRSERTSRKSFPQAQRCLDRALPTGGTGWL